MKKSGSIIALIAGIFGILSAMATLLIGGTASAFHASGSGTLVGLGWGGIVFSFLVIIFSAISMGSKNRVHGILLIISSILGIILGGTLVAVFMVLSLIGGILVTIGTKPKPESIIKA